MKKQTYIDLLNDTYEKFCDYVEDKEKYIGILHGICKCAYEDKEIDNEDYEEIADTKTIYIPEIIKK